MSSKYPDTELADATAASYEWLILEKERLDEEIRRLRDIIRRRLNCDGSRGRYHAGEHFDLTKEMNVEAAKLDD